MRTGAINHTNARTAPQTQGADFHKRLDGIMADIPCTAKDLAAASGLSEATISRYRAGLRTPPQKSEELARLLTGISALAGDDRAEVCHAALLSALPDDVPDPKRFANRLALLMERLSLNRVRLSAHAGYDPSFLSRVLSGERTPADPVGFADRVAAYVAGLCENSRTRALAAELLEEAPDVLRDRDAARHLITAWLTEAPAAPADTSTDGDRESIAGFLDKLDAFDLNDYMRRIRFDRLRLPPTRTVRSAERHFAGIEGMKKAELAFLKHTILSPQTAPVWEYSDLPMEELARDGEFSKKWMMGLALLLKKGLMLHIIHDVSRPFPEMMLGLESWIPLYMTGQIIPYYLPKPPETDFAHLFRLSGACMLVGECIRGDLTTAFFHLTSNQDAEKAMRGCREAFFRRAKPLMEIFREDRFSAFDALCQAEAEKNAPTLIAGAENIYFKNIRITRYGDRLVVVSKVNDPPIHFAIRHPRLIDAIARL